MIAIDKTTTVAEVMTERVIVVRPEETMDVVQDIFRKNNIHHVPVVDKGCIVGMVSHADYLKLLHGFTLFKTKKSDEYNDSILRSLLVREVMTKQVATLGPEDSLELAAGFFRENLFHALPVVDEDNILIGIVTTYDLLNYAYG
jgi:acetoin utilization protein AcuB